MPEDQNLIQEELELDRKTVDQIGNQLIDVLQPVLDSTHDGDKPTLAYMMLSQSLLGCKEFNVPLIEILMAVAGAYDTKLTMGPKREQPGGESMDTGGNEVDRKTGHLVPEEELRNVKRPATIIADLLNKQ